MKSLRCPEIFAYDITKAAAGRPKDQAAAETGAPMRDVCRGCFKTDAKGMVSEPDRRDRMDLSSYIKPELVVVAVALYVLGVAVKKSKIVNCRFIPLINGAAGILICMLYVFATETLDGARDVIMAAFTAITQGILTAGLSTYVHQMIKQMKEPKQSGGEEG